jgi:hypothetical protein
VVLALLALARLGTPQKPQVLLELVGVLVLGKKSFSRCSQTGSKRSEGRHDFCQPADHPRNHDRRTERLTDTIMPGRMPGTVPPPPPSSPSLLGMWAVTNVDGRAA